IERARTLVKTSCPLSPVTIRLDAQFGTPYPRSAGFDTDIGAFIESSTVPSPSGRMHHPVFKDGTVTKGALAIGQTLRLGGFLMTAKLSGHRKQPSRQLGTRRAVRSNGALFPKRALGSHRRPGSRYRL